MVILAANNVLVLGTQQRIRFVWPLWRLKPLIYFLQPQACIKVLIQIYARNRSRLLLLVISPCCLLLAFQLLEPLIWSAQNHVADALSHVLPLVGQPELRVAALQLHGSEVVERLAALMVLPRFSAVRLPKGTVAFGRIQRAFIPSFL